MEAKPEAGKPFAFEMTVSLDQLVGCTDVDGLNNFMDEYFWDKYGEEFMLGSITYKPLRVNEDETIVIQVHAAEVDQEEED